MLPSDAGTVPSPAMTVPGGAVVMLVTWHELQPIALNTLAPAFTAAVIGPRGGT